MSKKNSKIMTTPADQEHVVDRHYVFAVYDEKAAIYGNPVVHPKIELAIRTFTAACQNPQSFMYQFAADYSLYCIGTYDEKTSRITSYPEPRFVIRASEIVSQLSQLKETINAPALTN